MDQNKYFPCPSCQAPIQPKNKFCARCGLPTPEDVLHLKTEYFGHLQDPNTARLTIIHHQGQEGVSYHLQASEHTIGSDAQIQLTDSFISAQHARLTYQNARLQLLDLSSLNGAYTRIRKKTKLIAGDTFLIGEQVLRIELMPELSEETDNAGTAFYGSPIANSPFKIIQLLEGGVPGLTLCPHDSRATIGRQGCDMNILEDRHISAEHCVIEQDADGFSLIDLDTKNGTYIQIRQQQELEHGDYIMLGRSLLRIDMNA
ncbi:MAG: FHA domain-containing protein [Polyangiaceae bacterium]|nr:FHA domain-containing protein [Polyangiaceae bacterium]